ncbi:uncharacterized protein CDV56_107647 [Aspergillus thermomutatus]|uniref:Uncharacterized protein n=1 Tax=Aspergillus thermomutatus TaxID=41047 RepID=A0A397HVC0_ASPTH|nr:uncharacterized protein CDV56_107647 [Aspergillus thermomutatus]RHZ65506.1 hypothetical protein CDV56_107647 [Aspergillus thermomutatus]
MVDGVPSVRLGKGKVSGERPQGFRPRITKEFHATGNENGLQGRDLQLVGHMLGPMFDELKLDLHMAELHGPFGQDWQLGSLGRVGGDLRIITVVKDPLLRPSKMNRAMTKKKKKSLLSPPLSVVLLERSPLSSFRLRLPRRA